MEDDKRITSVVNALEATANEIRAGVEHAMSAKPSARLGRLHSLIENKQEQLEAARQELNEVAGFEVTSPVLIVTEDVDEDPCRACVVNDDPLKTDCHGCISEESREAYLAGKIPLLDPIE